VTGADFQASDCPTYNVCTTTKTREVVLADKLMGSEYARLKGCTLREPVNPADRANFLSLAQRFGAFEAAGERRRRWVG
jgi:hypothetical protein